ncbi:TadG family pilus assembly protein [Paraburkholderia sp. J94]|uniref:TadG family pilus assembly protein n=1 Tax=Paraburkholderia sp. J94 TaxID=2805441 RepID=UPI002AB06D85|nr:TadG family pilus assembly protein [Paraburkholderia sp. J94]
MKRRIGERHARPRAGARRQRGSIAIIAAFAVIFAVAALGVIDIANVYFQKRALQNVADFAALAAAQQMDDTCSQPQAVATANASSNGFTAQGSSSTLSVVCGRWDQTGQQANGSASMSFTPNGRTPYNGVAVTVTQTVPIFFLGMVSRQITATATAQSTIVGSFALATTLAQVNLLNGLLGSLLGGAAVNLSVASWNGIANANVKLADIAAAANVGTVKGLLDAQASVASLANVLATAVQQDGALTADVSAAVGGLTAFASAAATSATKIAIASNSGGTALLSLGLADAQSAANVSVNALQMLIVAAEIAQQGKPPVEVQLNLNSLPVVSSVLPATASLKVNVLSPPSIAVGQAGPNPGNPPPPWRTQAHNAQVTVALNLGFGNQSIAGLVSGITVNLPLYVEVAPATAGLASAQCSTTKAASRFVVETQTGIANLCVGNAPTTAAQLQSGSCSGQPAALIDVASLITVKAGLSVGLNSPQVWDLTFDGTGKPLSSTTPNTNQLGGSVGNALSSLSTQLMNPNNLSVSLVGLNLGLGVVVGLVTSLLAALLNPLLNALDTALIGPLLQLLGVQVGVANVTGYPLTCGVATLVQ